MRRLPVLFALSAVAIVLAGCASSAARMNAPQQHRESPNAALFADYWEGWLALNPISASYVGDVRFHDQLPNLFGEEHRAQQAAFRDTWLARLDALDDDDLDQEDRLSVEILRRNLRSEARLAMFPGELLPINSFYSLPSTLIQLGSGSSAQPFVTVADYEAWLRRSAQIPVLFDQIIANFDAGIAQQVVLPKILVERMLPQLAAPLAGAAEDSVFFRPVLAFDEAIPAEEQERLRTAYRDQIKKTLRPAYAKLHGYLQNRYLPAARTSSGWNALPQGREWYAALAAAMTTTTLTPEAIHQIGRKEVERLHGEMRAVIAEVGFEGDLKAFFQFLDGEPRFSFDSEEELLTAYEQRRLVVDARVDRLFAAKPSAAFEIRPVEAFRAASAAGGSYMTPSEDGTRPGIFYVNTYDLPSRKRWAVDNLFLHEAIPGHHYQLALQQESTHLPAFRRFGRATAYIEGWALYAESLGTDLGLYADPYRRFGWLQANLWRAIRLVVDTGLHEYGWTREQVIEYMLTHSALGQTQAVAETERYMAIPGQALSYKLGELTILRLRQEAEEALGSRFDIRQFHQQVLAPGALPLDLLEVHIRDWIAAQVAVPAKRR